MSKAIIALFVSAALASTPPPPVYTPVPYQKAPSYYPGYPYTFPPSSTRAKTCHVPVPANGGDAAPGIISTFKSCNKDAKIIFDNTTYHVNSVMETTGLSNVEVQIKGTLLWSNDTEYWLKHSLPEGYQNQSTAWIFGGDQVHLYGDGYGTLNGNGQIWYERTGAVDNYPGRPHQITFNGLTRSVVEGIRFLQSQMWTMTLTHCDKVLLQDIYISSTDSRGYLPQNTDGADTLYSNNIVFTRWTVTNGDDSISPKANSTNILIEDCTFYHGNSIALGSIAQMYGQYEQIVNLTVRNLYLNNTRWATYAKTFVGDRDSYPPNGGGGGRGRIHNVTISDLTVIDMRDQMYYVTQCLGETKAKNSCDSSTFQVSDVRVKNVKGTLLSNTVASIQCSGAASCTGMEVSGIDVTYKGKEATSYLCSDVKDPVKFTCTGRTPQT